MTLPRRRPIRLKGYDYSSPGYYFITICTKEKKKWLCEIVGTAVPGGPLVQRTKWGTVVENRLAEMSDFYDDVKIEKYVVMPNHIHLLIHVLEPGGGLLETTGGPSRTTVGAGTSRTTVGAGPSRTAVGAGPSRTTVPTSKVSRFIGTFKRLCNRECGESMWQGRSYDHIIRDERDYLRIWTYIDQNPAKWEDDCFYTA